jgi:hypothetical protein
MANKIPKPPSLQEQEKVSTFINKFTAAERTAIWNHLQVESNALTIYARANSVGPNALENDPVVQAAMTLAVSAGLITSLRKDAILVTIG